MSAPSFAAARSIAFKDLALEARRHGSLLPALLFTVVTRVLFDFALPGRLSEPEVFAGMLWLLVAFSLVVGIGDSFRSELQHETLQALLAAPIDRSWIFLGKFFANWVRITLLQLLALVLLVVSTQLAAQTQLSGLLTSIALFGAGLAAIGTLFAAISARLQRGETLLALLLPAASPLFIGALQTTSAALAGKTDFSNRWWLLGAGLTALYGFLSLMTFEFVVED